MNYLTLIFTMAVFSVLCANVSFAEDGVNPSDWPEAYEYQNSKGAQPSWDMSLTKHNAEYLSKFMDTIPVQKPKAKADKKAKGKKNVMDAPGKLRIDEDYPNIPVVKKQSKPEKRYRFANSTGFLRWDSAISGYNADELSQMMGKQSANKTEKEEEYPDSSVDYY